MFECRRFRMRFVAALLFSTAAFASAQEVSVDWRIKQLSMKSAVVHEGPAWMVCAWTAVITKTGTWSQPVQWSGIITLDGQVVQTFERTYSPSGASYTKPGSNEYQNDAQKTLDEAAGYDFTTGTATNEFDGRVEPSITVTTGTHKVGCMVAATGTATHEASSRLANNKEEITIDVKPMGKVEPGTFPTYKTPAVASNADRNKGPQAAAPSTGTLQLPPSANAQSPASDVASPSAQGRVLRPGERLTLRDGNSLMYRGPIIGLFDAKGNLLKNFESGAEVHVSLTGEVTVRTGKTQSVVGYELQRGGTQELQGQQEGQGTRSQAEGQDLQGKMDSPRQGGKTQGSTNSAAVPSVQGQVKALGPGEKLRLQNGNSLMLRGSTLVMLNPQGHVLKNFESGAEVIIGAAGEVSVRTGTRSEPVGLLQR